MRRSGLVPLLAVFLLTGLALLFAYRVQPTIQIEMGKLEHTVFLQDFQEREVEPTGPAVQHAWPAGHATLVLPGRRWQAWLLTLHAAEGQPDRALDPVGVLVNGVQLEIIQRPDTRQLQALLPEQVASADQWAIQVVAFTEQALPATLVDRIEPTPARVHRWTSQQSKQLLPGLGRGSWRLDMLVLTVHPDGSPVHAEIFANDTLLARAPDRSEPQRLSMVLPAEIVSTGNLELVVRARTYHDPRPLGISLSKVLLVPLEQPGSWMSWLPPWHIAGYSLLIILGWYGIFCLLLKPWQALVAVLPILSCGAYLVATQRFPTLFMLPRVVVLTLFLGILLLFMHRLWIPLWTEQTRRQVRLGSIGLFILQAGLPFIVGGLFPAILLPGGAFWEKAHARDMRLFSYAADHLVRGEWPYRDFKLEYPPGALIAFVMPYLTALQPTVVTYSWFFLLESVLWTSLIASILLGLTLAWRPAARVLPVLGWYSVLLTLSLPLTPWRYDLLPALLSLAALLALVKQRPAWAGGWLALGILTKLYPIVLLPIWGIYYISKKSYRDCAWFMTICVTIVVLFFVPFVTISPGEILYFLQYHQMRGIQVESIAGAIMLLAGSLGLVHYSLEVTYGAVHIIAPMTDSILKLLPIVLIGMFGVLLCTVWFRFREEHSAPALVEATLGALLLFIVTNKVFSPQYIVWILPFIPLLQRRYIIITCLIFVLTIVVFPFNYDALLRGDLVVIVLLNLRNLLMIVLAYTLCRFNQLGRSLAAAASAIHVTLPWFGRIS